MEIFPIWRTANFPTEESEAVFRIMKWGTQEIYRGRGRRYPGEEYLTINLNKPTQNTIDSMIYEALGESVDTVAASNAYAEFSLQFYSESNDTWTTVYEFAMINDWSYEDHEGNIYSDPINGHACPGMVLPYSYLVTGETETVCYDEWDLGAHIFITPSEIIFSDTGGTATVIVTANCHWWIQSVTGSYLISRTEGESGATEVTITAPANGGIEEILGHITFRARNNMNSDTAELEITQRGAEPYVDIITGDQEHFRSSGGTWEITYETNLNLIYYEVTGPEGFFYSGYTSGGMLTVELPRTPNGGNYTVNFYTEPGGTLLDTATATVAEATPAERYLTFKIATDGVIGWRGGRSSADCADYPVYFCKNGGEWEEAVAHHDPYVEDDPGYLGSYYISVQSGDTLQFKAVKDTYCPSENAPYRMFRRSTAIYDIEGNIMSLIYGDDFDGKTAFAEGTRNNLIRAFYNEPVRDASKLILPVSSVNEQAYMTMFKGCSNLIAGPKILANDFGQEACDQMFANCTALVETPEINATGIIKNFAFYLTFSGCTALERFNGDLSGTQDPGGEMYNSMFYGCTALTVPPQLPQTEIAQGAYDNMFHGCTALVNAPALPATALTRACYYHMFAECTSLVNAPVLPADYIPTSSYDSMFSGCTSLTSITCYATGMAGNSQNYGSTRWWTRGVPESGTFTRKTGATFWPTGVNGIPTGWTVIDN